MDHHLLSTTSPIDVFKTRHSPTSGAAICTTVPRTERGPQSSKPSATSSYGSRDVSVRTPTAVSA